jgi:phosphomannomutase/phosphoglucomutase
MKRIFSSLSILAVLMILISGAGVYWFNSSYLAESKQATADAVAKGAALSLSGRIDTLNAILDQIARDPEVLSAIAANNPNLIAAVTAKLERYFPGAQKIRLLPPGVNELDDKSAPRMSLGDLEMVRGAFASDQLPAIQGEAAADRHLALTRRIMLNNQPIGVILASLKYEFIRDALKSAQGNVGYLELKQDRLILAVSGTKNDLGEAVSSRFKIPQTGWELFYETAESEQGSIEMIAALIGIPGIIVLAGFFLGYRKFSDMLMQDLSTVASACKDMMRNKLQGSYLMRMNEFNVVVSSLAQHKRLQDNKDKIVSDEREDLSMSGFLLGDIELDIEEPLIPKETINDPKAKVKLNFSKIAKEDPINKADELAAIFRAFDIRGVVGASLTRDVVFNIGRALGTNAKEHGCNIIVVGRDGRASSQGLSESLAQGIVTTGCNVLNIGLAPTPLLYFVAHHIGGRSGVMITGSHNPAQYNGLKMVIKGETLVGDKIQKLKQCIDNQAFATANPGAIERNDRHGNEYIGTISEDIHIARPMKVVLDCDNGVVSELGPVLFRTLGCEVIELFCDIDGAFPNHHPDPSKPENLNELITAVKHYEADLGIAFDGDGDRFGVVDSIGKIIWPDRQMMLFAKDVLSGKPGAEIIHDVKCSRHLATEITKYGGRPVMWKSGPPFMKAKLKETGAMLAGEMSGRIYFNDRWLGFDDALYAAARLIAILSADTRSSAEVFGSLPDSINSPELTVELPEGENIKFIKDLISKTNFAGGKITNIDGLRVDFPDGWGLVRASNTTPSLAIRFEADTVENLKTIQERFRQQMKKVKPDIILPF